MQAFGIADRASKMRAFSLFHEATRPGYAKSPTTLLIWHEMCLTYARLDMLAAHILFPMKPLAHHASAMGRALEKRQTLRFALYFSLLTGLLCGPELETSFANANEDMGYGRLVRYLPPGTVATGSGVPVMLVEASLSGTALPLTFTPVNMLTSGTVAGTGNLSGKTFFLTSGSSAYSWHAEVVADYFFGNQTDSSVSPFRASMAPGVTTINTYLAGSSLPDSITEGVVRSNAWIGYGTGTAIRDFIRSYDDEIEDEGVIHVGGANNGLSTSTPSLLAGAYNVITAGLSNGNHSRGLTPLFTEEPNLLQRFKPDITAPIDLTSWATAIVSSAATLLYDSGTGSARDGLVVRAAMFAGASRDEPEFIDAGADWLTLSSTQPVHSHLGVGEVDVYRAHGIISSPAQLPNAAATKPNGWNKKTISASGQDSYLLTVPTGAWAAEASAAVVWNSVISSGTRLPLPNINLELLDSGSNSLDISNSAQYNVELVSKRLLVPGTYILNVSGPVGTPYAVAWIVDLVLNADITLSRSGSNVVVTVDDLVVGKQHRLQRYAGIRWDTLSTFTTVSSTLTYTDVGGAPPIGTPYLYRVLRDDL